MKIRFYNHGPGKKGLQVQFFGVGFCVLQSEPTFSERYGYKKKVRRFMGWSCHKLNIKGNR